MSFFSINQKVNLARSLFTKNSPAYVQYYITSRCNLSCEQCNIIYADADSTEMNIYQIRSMAENFAEIGVCIILLIGGEPFMRKDLPEIIDAFVKNGIHVRMQTNGLATEKMLEKCVNAGGHDISISLDSLVGSLQDDINGCKKNSWNRAINAVSIINKIFPKNGTGFFGSVLMPKNIEHICDVIEFATEIGWGVSLVPVHTTTETGPRGFRLFDNSGICTFTPDYYPRLEKLIEELKILKKRGMNFYDSEEYINDIYRYLTGEPIRWRRKNNNVCDSPSLYFAVEPNGNIRPCCDYKLDKPFPVYDKRFISLYKSGIIHKEINKFTKNCDGCMYGSYPEITISARYILPFLERLLFFNVKTSNILKKYSYNEMIELAQNIYAKNEKQRKLI